MNHPESTPPELSIVIASYNRRSALEKCLRALAASRRKDYEVVVVDDGSTDDTIGMLEEMRASAPQIRLSWLVNPKNSGANTSRNRGVRHARGRLVAFLDSDCVPRPDWADRITEHFADESVGAATGLVIEDRPRNAFDRTLWGMNRARGDKEAARLVAGNLCVRRRHLLRFPLDEDLKYGCDEEGLFLRLRAAGIRQVFVPEAIVVHEHRFDASGFFRQAWLGGRGAAWLVYKFRLKPRIDVVPLICCYLALPFALLDLRALWLSAFFLLVQVAALIYNDVFRKGKGPVESLVTLPLLLAYYHVRVAAYLLQTVRLRFRQHGLQREDLSRAGRPN